MSDTRVVLCGTDGYGIVVDEQFPLPDEIVRDDRRYVLVHKHAELSTYVEPGEHTWRAEFGQPTLFDPDARAWR